MRLRTLLSAVSAQAFKHGGFRASEAGGITTLSLFGVLGCCMIAGVAVDVSNLYRNKEHLTLTADAASFAGIVKLAQTNSTSQAQAAVAAAIEKNMPVKTFGKVTTATDVQMVRYDPMTKKVVAGTPNAVKVTVRRDDSVGNPIKTGLLRLAGFDEFETSVSSVAYYGQPGRCQSSDGIYAKGQVTITSGNWIGPSYCVHSQTAVWLPQQNTFAAGSGVSMPSLAACKGKCVDSANPGIEKAKFEMNLNLPKVADHITAVINGLTQSPFPLRDQVFANKPRAADLSALTTAKITKNKSQENALIRGSVVTLTAAQYNDLMSITNGLLPSGLVYQVDCRNNGNSPATSISIGGSKNRKNASLASTTIETVKGVVVIADCSFDVGPYARVDNSVMISTRVSSSSSINSEEGAVVGDPAKNCNIDRKVYVLTQSGFSVNSNFTASNVAMISNGNINVAASSGSSTTTHNGTSFHSEGSIQIPANHTFNSCAEDNSLLLPTIKTFKYVMPS
ncbi:MAG: TadG family pilus assembly protein [Tabrizicola sp.]|uniref:TadG family pilus assembly protein n=1 Tax=Tabrizicola sp. TaxID=2005166 RepID=UPI0027336A83|nr:TadG family pilus assembly protein [Tabrizicola sp.]MDP3262875.1 TadG family pilus assembly protein [Tabrizicola sp.]MDP3649072.1 TadG family pilus assembly protein [Paracoccaceae bacterium]MDZ4066139.1 TadG family pilus assembly protein [Tabrizicola sp.]